VQFLNPIWLFAVAAVLIPVIIHLWNIKAGKTLKVGSIALITADAQKSSRSFKLKDVLLFMVRCLFLLILAFLLAMPVWQRYVSNSKAKGWLLIPRENLKESYKQFKPTIDSLAKAGFEFHYFNKGFSKENLNKALLDSALNTDVKAGKYWNLIAGLDEKLPADMPVYVFTPNQGRYFTSKKPSVSLNLHWQTYTPADSVNIWVKDAWFTDDNSIKAIVGNSKPSGTYFTNYVIQSEGDPKSPFTLSVDHGKPVISLKTDKERFVVIDTTILKIAVYTDKYNLDASYLKAALQAVSSFTQRKTTIKQYTNAALLPAGQSWIFWLSDKPVDADVFRKAVHVFNYEAGKVMTESSWIKTNAPHALSETSTQVSLYKLIKNETEKGQPVWTDGYSNSILSTETGNGRIQYRFYSRFNPAWNDLVWNDNFPKLLLKLILYKSDYEDVVINDRSVIAHDQLMPNKIWSAKNAVIGKVTEQTDLSHSFWLALVALFLVERWLAHKNKPVLKHG
jgi:hypothetical protein